MRLLLFGRAEDWTVGTFFYRAMQTMDVDCACVDLRRLPGPQGFPLIDRISNRLVRRFFVTGWRVNRAVIKAASTFRPDVLLVVKGDLIAPATLVSIKKTTGCVLVNYATDDPFNPVSHTRDLVAAIPLYDLYACTKRAIIKDVRSAGCPNVVFVPFGYDPSYHRPESFADEDEAAHFMSDVVFIGGGDPDRYPTMEAVASDPSIQLHLYGGYWGTHPRLKGFYRGFVVGRDYRLALAGTKIALGLVRHSNRDGHSMRTFETPACAAFMLAERTDEHMEFFREDKEAAFFGSKEELLDKVRYYLGHEAQRSRIARAGQERVISARNTYRDRLIDILQHAQRL